MSPKRLVRVSALEAAVSATMLNSRAWLRRVPIMRSALPTRARASFSLSFVGALGGGVRAMAQATAGRPATAVTRLAISAGVVADHGAVAR